MSGVESIAEPSLKRVRDEQASSSSPAGVTMAEKRRKTSFMVPSFDASSGKIDCKEFIQAFSDVQCVLIKNVSNARMTLEDVGKIFSIEVGEECRHSWSIETPDVNLLDAPKEVLTSEGERKRFYASFLTHHDIKSLPLNELPVGGKNTITYMKSYWFFVGLNGDEKNQTNLGGRDRHTDDVPQDGTFHYQASGSKIWYLEPTKNLLQIAKSVPQNEMVEICCSPGDMLVLNTRNWFHRTELPFCKGFPSISFAREFFLEEHPKGVRIQETDFGNVETIYATEDIEEHTIILREGDMPDMELPTSKIYFNTRVVELEGEAGLVLVSTRNIRQGEQFFVHESDEETEEA